MKGVTQIGAAAADYAFRFDQPTEPVVFGGELDLTGWLVHLGGKPVHGIRAIVRRSRLSRTIIKARRKRNRPDVAAAYPDLPDAKASGFLVELRLPLGRSTVALQVLDHDRVWRTFHTRSVAAFPLKILTALGLTHTKRVSIFALKRMFSHHPPLTSPSAKTELTAGRTTKRVELFATSKSNLFILEIAELIGAGFRELGCESVLRIDEVPDRNSNNGTLQVVVTPHEFYNLFLVEKIGRSQARALSRSLLLLSTEQPDTGWFESNVQWSVFARAVADINPLGVAAYQRRGLRCHHLQLGYDRILAAPQITPHRERAYDIMFLGSLTPRRDEFFAEHAPFFAEHRCQIRLVPLGFAKTKQTRSYLPVERRNELLNASKILLNLHYSEQKYFEWHRMLVAIANGCCVITETCEGFGPLIPGKHFIMVEPQFLVPCCEYYLAHPDECERIAQEASAFLQSDLRQSRGCEDFLNSVETERAPEIVGDSPPANLPRALVRKLMRDTVRMFAGAVRADAAAWRRKEPLPPAAAPAPRREEVVERRQTFGRRLKEQRNAEDGGEITAQIHDNPAYRRCADPALTVVITLYNYERFIDGCVASVEKSAAELKQPVEVVIVNDASEDNSLLAALRCQRTHDRLAIRVLDKKFNTGLADARNTGIRTARAPFVFILDADNLVLPGAFVQLLEAISADDYAAAFSLLCRFRGTPDNRVGLLSYYDWDPEILVQYPYIDAMAMFRREALLEAGGYDNELSQVGWFGWEDYEMWLRFAQRGYKVAFVPNILCLYRHHETSMINTTNLFEVELVNHLLGRYGDLADTFQPREQLLGVDRHRLARR